MMSIGNESDKSRVLDETRAEPIVRAAVEGGTNFFDTADTYSAGATRLHQVSLDAEPLPGVTVPIVATSEQAHADDALAAGQSMLSEEAIPRLEEPYVPHPVLGHG
jgi:aryl-alcohol dehydrogenase-like predicted oxidoreductase